MLLSVGSSLNAIAEFITVLFIFLLILAITYFTTRWIANFQKQKINSANIHVIETYRITTNKYLQIIQAGKKCFVIAVCKDTVTYLTEISEDDLDIRPEEPIEPVRFKEILEKAKKITTMKKE